MATPVIKRRGKGGPKSSSAKRPREDEGRSGGPFDQLCDDALLRIVSYTNDLRSLVRFTMCTSKSLRGRFDPKSTSRAQGECHKIWKGVFADLQMDPPDLDYLGAINDRMALLKTLVGHDKRRKLPLRHYYFKPLSCPWRLEYNSDDSWEDECAVENSFSLMSSGTGGEYIIVNPETYMLEAYSSVLDHTVCFDKSIQKKREGYHHFNTLEETLDDARWEEALDVARGVVTGNTSTQIISNVALPPSGRVPCARIEGEGNKFWTVRVVKETPSDIMVGAPLTFTEVYVWTKGDGGEDSGSQFRVKSMTRIPGEWDAGIGIMGNQIYGSISEEAYNDIPERYRTTEVPSAESAVFVIPMNTDLLGPLQICRPQRAYLSSGIVSSIKCLDDKKQLLVGTEEGQIEIFDTQTSPHRIHTLHADDTFNESDERPNTIMRMREVGDSLGLIVEQSCTSKGSAISLFQPSPLESGIAADLRVVARIRYPRFIQCVLVGHKLMVLSYDKFGWAYVDVFIVLGARFVFDDLDCPKLPKDVELVNLHPHEEQRIKFLNRIHTHYRVDFEGFYEESELASPKPIRLDANERFIVITANDGLVDRTGNKKSGPGMIVIDLDSHKHG